MMTTIPDDTTRVRRFLAGLAPGGRIADLAPIIADRLAGRALPRGVALEPLLRRLDAGSTLSFAEAEAVMCDLLPAVRPIRPVQLATDLRDVAPDADASRRLSAALEAVGLLHDGPAEIGTCVMVGDGLVMTTRHQATAVCEGLGLRRAALRAGAAPEVRFATVDGAPRASLAVTGVAMLHPYWDMALLRVAPGGPAPVALSGTPRGAGGAVVLAGFPRFDPAHPFAAQCATFGGAPGRLHLAPGALTGPAIIASHDRRVPALTHDALPLGATPGGALIDAASGTLLGLQFATHAFERSFCVPASALAADARVVAAGVHLDGPALRGPTEWEPVWRQVDPEGATPAGPLGQGDAAHLPHTLRRLLDVGAPVRRDADEPQD